MSKRIIDYKQVDMTNDEHKYYKEIIDAFSDETYSATEQFHDIFDVDGDGCITMIRPSLKKEVSWSVLFFLQNLMINQRLRRMERWIRSRDEQ